MPDGELKQGIITFVRRLTDELQAEEARANAVKNEGLTQDQIDDINSIDNGEASWPVCHIDDNTGLYITILRAILEGKGEPSSGKNGFYLASPGRVKWLNLYRAIAEELATRGVVDTAEVGRADEQALKHMAQGVGGDVDMVPFQAGGECTFTAKNGRQIGWTPVYEPQHILDTSKEEVQLIQENSD